MKGSKKTKTIAKILVFGIVFAFTISFTVKPLRADNLGTKIIDGVVNLGENFIEDPIGTSKRIASNLAPGQALGNIMMGTAVNIMDEAFEGLTKCIADPVTNTLDSIKFLDIAEIASPSSGYINTLLPGVIDWIYQATTVLGAVITLILFVLYFICYMMSPDKLKVSPLKMFVRLILVAAFIMTAKTSMDWLINDVLQPIANQMKFVIADDPSNGESLGSMLVRDQTILGLNIKLFQEEGKPYKFIPVLVSFLMIIPIIKELVRTLIEFVERYIVLQILYTLSPVAAATFTSDTTENVGKSYIQMILAQFFLVTMSFVFTYGSIFCICNTYIVALQGNNFIQTIVAYIACLGVMKAFQRLDSHLRAMGIGVAQTGGALADSLQSSIRNTGRMLGGAFRGANSGRKAAGMGMQAIGAQVGNQSLFNAGAIMGATIAGGGIPGNSALNKKYAEMRGGIGKSAAMDGQSAGNIIAGYLQDYRSNQRAAGALDKESLKAGIHALTGLDVTSASLDGRGGVSMTWKDEHGTHTGTFSYHETPDSMALTDTNGNFSGYLSTDSNESSFAVHNGGQALSGDSTSLSSELGDSALFANSDIYQTDATSRIDTAIANDDGHYYGNQDSGEFEAAALNLNGKHPVLYQNSGITEFEEDSGMQRLTDDGKDQVIAGFKKAYGDYEVDKNSMYYNNDTKQVEMSVKAPGSANYVEAYAKDVVNPGSLSKTKLSGESYISSVKTVTNNRNSEHRTAMQYAITQKKKKTDKK